MLQMIVFTSYQVDTEKKAASLLEFFEHSGDIFTPVRFDTKEPVRKPYIPNKRDEPIRLLSGGGDRQYGQLFLGGEQSGALVWLRWASGQVSQWFFQVDESFFRRADAVEAMIHFIEALCQRVPIIFGGAAPEEDWRAKHWKQEDESEEKFGLSLDGCLPGIYWLTVMGADVAAHFGRSKIGHLPAHRVIDLGNAGAIIVVRASPYDPEQKERLREDAAVAEALGRQYFFDLQDREKTCAAIPGVTSEESGDSDVEEDAPESGSSGLDIREAGEGTLANDGSDHNPDTLAEKIVVYLHRDVREVYSYSRESLVALDGYFASHPVAHEYRREFLDQDFIPALGAYFGKVLTSELGGRWRVLEPVLRSTVLIDEREVSPFQLVSDAQSAGSRLRDLFDSVAVWNE